jgi:IclR family transcriptional regulator, acetate operon repressor
MNMNEGVKTAVRTVNLFEAFARRKGPMTLTQIAESLSAPISSCHGLVRTLSGMGYLYTSEQTRAIYPTKRLLEIASVIAAHDPVLESMVPILEALRDETKETVLLGRRQGDPLSGCL